jgi:hypothetical protein
MRYNPSQATRLLLGSLNILLVRQNEEDFREFLHSGSGESRNLLLNVLLDTSCPCLFPEVRISSVKPSSATRLPHHKAVKPSV